MIHVPSIGALVRADIFIVVLPSDKASFHGDGACLRLLRSETRGRAGEAPSSERSVHLSSNLRTRLRRPADGMSVSLAWERNPSTELISDLSIQISLPPGFPDRYRTAVVRASDQCTVNTPLLEAPAIEVVAV